MTIGEVARRAGMRTSAIRYYESLGLLPAPARRGGRRQYGEEVLSRLSLLGFAKSSGFTLREIRSLFATGKPYSTRMREQARTKLAEIDGLIERAQMMKTLLRIALRCNCLDLDQCGRRVARLTGAGRTCAPRDDD